MRCRAIAVWVCCGLFACDGAEPPPPKTPAAVTVESQEPDVAPEREPATIVDMVERDAEIFAYFDVEEFRRGPLFRAGISVVERVFLARDWMKGFVETCGVDPAEALLEISLSSRMREGRPDFDTAVVVARTNASSAASLDCFERLVPQVERRELDGHPAVAFGDTGAYVVAVEPFLLLGEAETVRRALVRLQAGARARVPDEVLYAELKAAELLEAERIVVSAVHGARGTEWNVRARATSTAEAEKIESSVREFRRESLEELATSDLEPAAKNLATELVESITFQRRGAELEGDFSFGSRERETAILGTASSMVAAQLDQHLRSYRTTETRLFVVVIAAQLREYAMKQTPPRFPESGLLVPSRVPAASSYKSVDADWQQGGWKDIEFRTHGYHPYAFGFETTRGGLRVKVSALGDLDGDGRQSRFETELEIRQGQVVGGNQLREVDVFE